MAGGNLVTPLPDRTSEDLPREEVEARIHCAVRKLEEADGFLLRNTANERTITHRLAMHLDPLFPSWAVDVEYNREGAEGETKRIRDWEQFDLQKIAGDADREELVRDMEARTVYPDIIVHQRGLPENLLVMEVKKSSSTRPPDVDRGKLRVMVHEAGLDYSHAVFLQLPADNDPPEALTLDSITKGRATVS